MPAQFVAIPPLEIGHGAVAGSWAAMQPGSGLADADTASDSAKASAHKPTVMTVPSIAAFLTHASSTAGPRPTYWLISLSLLRHYVGSRQRDPFYPL